MYQHAQRALTFSATRKRQYAPLNGYSITTQPVAHDRHSDHHGDDADDH